MTRRQFLGTVPVGVVGLAVARCGGSISAELTVHPADDGRSVYEATARYYRVGVDSDPAFRARYGSPKVTHIGGTFSRDWIFEVNGRRYEGNRDSALGTHVRAGETITWREV